MLTLIMDVLGSISTFIFTRVPSSLYRLSVEEYDRIVRMGIFGHDEKVELIEGMIVPKEDRDRSYPLTAKQAMVRF
jgi:hypothetical protein